MGHSRVGEKERAVKYIASCSFGKDSFAMVLMLIEKEYPLDEIVYCHVKATRELSGEYPEMVSYIETAKQYLEKLIKEKGLAVKIVTIENELSFNEYFYRIREKGKRQGQIYGFPYTLGAWCNDRLKIRPIDKYFKAQGKHIRYIGLAADEPERLARLADNERAPLAEWGLTETEARKYLKSRGLLCPLYLKFTRLGCWFCPKQSNASLEILFREYPELWERLKAWQDDSVVPFQPRMTVHDIERKFIIESRKKECRNTLFYYR